MPVSAALYQFFSLYLLYPQPELHLQWQEAAQAVGQPWATALAAQFAATSLDDLQVEHTRLFVNNAEGVPCPPYESAYVDRQLLTATTAAVANFYAEWDIQQAQETADFLPVELQFSAYLLDLAAQSEAPESVEQARRRFEANHLLRWLPQFAVDLEKHAQLDCYRELGKRLAEFATELAR